jgi:hypothetical protein
MCEDAMPIHDWTRVPAGTWHAFHLAWIAALQETLNNGLLPAGYYALAEQVVRPMVPDVLLLERHDPPDSAGGVAVASVPSRARLKATTSAYIRRQRQIAIRHVSDDKTIALIELVSPGNKSSIGAMQAFLDKAVRSLDSGIHLLIVDLFPPGARDPQGIHAAIWSELGEVADAMPLDEPLTLAAYASGPQVEANVEPTAVGRALIEMPLFLTPAEYVNVPLEPTYETGFRGLPQHVKRTLEA